MIYLATEQTGNYQKDAELAHKQWENALLEGKWFSLDEWKKRFETYLLVTGHHTENKGDDSLRDFIVHFDLYRYTKAFLAAERKALENGKSTGLSAGSILHLTGRAFGDVPAKSMDDVSRSTLNLPDYVPPEAGKERAQSAFDSRSDAERLDYSDSEWKAHLDPERKAFLEGLDKALAKGISDDADWNPGLIAWGGAGNEHGPSIEELAREDLTKPHIGEIAVDNYGRISFPLPPAAPDKDSIEPLSQESIEDCCRGWGWRMKLCASCGLPLLIEGKKAGAQKRHPCCEADGRKADKRKYWHGPKHSELLAKRRDKRQP